LQMRRKKEQMTNEKQVVLMIRGAISTMPEENRAKIMACYDAISAAVKDSGEDGQLALALAGAEMAVEE